MKKCFSRFLGSLIVVSASLGCSAFTFFLAGPQLSAGASAQYIHLDHENTTVNPTAVYPSSDYYTDNSFPGDVFLKNRYICYKDGIGYDAYGFFPWTSGVSGGGPFRGSKALAIRIDGTTGVKDRYELCVVHHNHEKALSLYPQNERYFGFAFYLPSAFEYSKIHLAQVWQWCDTSLGAVNNIIFFSLDNNELKVVLQDENHDQTVLANLGTIAKLQWHTLIMKLKPSYPGDGVTGLFQVWLNTENEFYPTFTWNSDWGVKPEDAGGITGTYSTFDIRTGVYRSAQDRNHHIYFDQHKYGAVFDDVKPSVNEKRWEFEYDGDLDGWDNPTRISNLRQENGMMKGTIADSDPYVKSYDDLGVSLAEYSKIKVRLRNSMGDGVGKFYFITESDPVWDGAKSKAFSMLIGGTLQTVTVDMAEVSGWTGVLKQLRFDPCSGGSGSFEIESIMLCQ